MKTSIQRVLTLLLVFLATLAAPHAEAGTPKHLSARTLAPIHGFDPLGARVEVGDLHLGNRPTPGAADPIRNAYFTSTPSGAFSRMKGRLVGKDPLRVSAQDLEALGPSISKAKPAAPAGKTVVRVSKENGFIEFQFADRTELLKLDLPRDTSVDDAGVLKVASTTQKLFYTDTRRPDHVSIADGSFTIFGGGVRLVGPEPVVLRDHDENERPVAGPLVKPARASDRRQIGSLPHVTRSF